MRFDLSDDEWAFLEPLMPKSRMRVRVDDRRIMNAIFYVPRTGMRWRDLPERDVRWSRLSEQVFRFDKWSLCRG
jgi:transposase